MAPPSTFASAAAGGNTPTTPRADSGGEWARRTNGATQTFRRPSVATSMTSSNPREASSSAQPAVYVPPHRNGPPPSDTRYSKNQLLDLFRSKQEVEGSLDDALPDLFVGGWEPTSANGAPSNAWSRRDDQAKDHAPGPEVCWDKDGATAPLGLADMDEEEREHFLSVNSPLKPPTAVGKDSVSQPIRKISVSQNVNSPGGYAVNSPGAARPGGPRRRDTQDAYPFPSTSQLSSPSVVKTARDESRTTSPPPSLTRRRTDFKDVPPAKDLPDDKSSGDASDAGRPPFAALKRATTGPLNTAVGGASSPWSATPQSAAFSPMGAFGNFAVAPNATVGTSTDKRPGLAGGRAESRFKGLMSKENEDGKERTLQGSTARTNDTAPWRHGVDQVPEDDSDDQVPTGSAALGGGQDISPPRSRGVGTPSRQDSRDDFGFAAFGMTSDPFRNLIAQQQEQYHGTPQARPQQQQQQQQQQQATGNEPMSPTDTNPYQSPEHVGSDPDDLDTDGSDINNVHLPGLGGMMNESLPSGPGAFGGLGNLGRVPAAPPSDRSQTSSVGPNRGFGGLTGLGALPGLGGASAWGGAPATIGTPNRERAGLAGNFAENVFGPSAELGSPSPAGLAGLGAFGAHPAGPGASRGGSRLGSLFPPSMQEQMRAEQNRHAEEGSEAGDFSNPPRDNASPFRHADMAGGFTDPTRNTGFGSAAQTPSLSNPEPIGQRPGQPSASMQPQPVSSSASNQPPPAQQKTMVMPDRMRWIYRDPQGVTQGPWSGLEMHDWYKAGFFSPELLVKKYEDPDYEPLAQLIRRIGNSREPFLVPQIGIPHGPPTAQPATTWTNPLSSGGAQPPFASSFPSFGTTLTADQQNALERRKQEEQYLMARQKEHLAQQQIAQRFQMQSGQSIFPPLNHHSSAHSLHSQPSFGSLTSPAPFQPSPLQSGLGTTSHVPGFFDNSFRSGPLGGLGAVGAGVDMLGNIREEEMPGMLNRLNLGRPSQSSFGGIGQPIGQSDDHAQRVAAMLNDRSRLEQEQAQHDTAQRFRQEQSGSSDRFQQFQNLQDQARADPFSVGSGGVIGKPIAPPTEQQEDEEEHFQNEIRQQAQAHLEQRMQADEQSEISAEDVEASLSGVGQSMQQEHLSLTEQVQKAASVKQSPAPAPSVWGKVDTALPQPFPPAPSQSPLPAPAAQRNRSNVADALHAESRSRSQTPSAETPGASIAPWAKEPAEAPRGPSLKEIQEAEAKVAAEAEALAAEARRAAFEKELLAQTQATQMTPGLPSSSNWASSATASPAVVVAAPSPWAKAAKAAAPTSAAKSMAQIQKEEEARKKRLAAAAAATQASVAGVTPVQPAGKRYADLASKIASPAPASPVPVVGGAWTTVGASGKVKTPAPAPTPVNPRVASGAAVPTIPAVAKKTVPARAATASAGVTVNAQEEFKKWAVNELKHDLNKSVTADDFISNLLAFPSEIDIVTEAVHSVSQTIDSRHFAEEFIRRRKLADKGLIDNTKPASPASLAAQSGGWSEVAKKGPSSKEPKEDMNNGSFKVVAAKKKGVKR